MCRPAPHDVLRRAAHRRREERLSYAALAARVEQLERLHAQDRRVWEQMPSRLAEAARRLIERTRNEQRRREWYAKDGPERLALYRHKERTMNVTVIHGPEGCGKSRRAKALQRHFASSTVIDGWDGRSPLPAGALALTNVPPPYPIRGVRILSFEQAQQLLTEASA